MKKNLFLLAMILVLPLFLQSPTHAAMTPYNSTSSNSIVNYADLYYPAYMNGGWGLGYTVGVNNPVQNSHSYSNNFENVFDNTFTLSGHSGVSFTGSADAASGISNGVLYSTASASMTYEGFTGSLTDTPGVDATQLVTSTFTQYYYDPDGSTIEVTGLLNLGETFSGLLESLELLESDDFFDYSISAKVTVNENTFSLTGTNSNTNIAVLDLDLDNLTDSAIITIKPGEIGVAGDYYYSITTSLTIEAILDNHEYSQGVVSADALSGIQYMIGDSENPIMLTASLSVVSTPVPSSLLLLISGIAGISFIRRRRS